MTGPDEAFRTRVATLLKADRFADAGALCRETIRRGSDVASAHNFLGVIAARGGDLPGAVTHFTRAAELDTGNAEYYRNLGFAQSQVGRLAEGAASLVEALRLAPGDIVALHELGRLRQAQGNTAEAAECFRQFLEREPASVMVRLAYGNCLVALGRMAAAADAFRHVLAQAPESLEARFSLACAQSSLGNAAGAIALYREIERRRPDYPALHVNLGVELKKTGRCAEAIRHYDLAIAQNPDDYMAYNNRGNALCAHQRYQEAEASFRRALDIKPDYNNARSNLLLCLNYTESSQQRIYDESLAFEHQHAAPLRPTALNFSNTRDPERRLRVGYVSADFRRHSVAWFLRGVLASHDPAQVEVFCYSDLACPDPMTEQLRSLAKDWRPIFGVTDADVARRIGADGIDILVDLSGHTAGNRLLVFARKPAPVQVSWLGYPNTTGMRAMDYRLTDAIADPPGEADALHVEKLIRLPGGFLCYQPQDSEAPATVATSGGITFGSFNALPKLTPEVVSAWSVILLAVPGSRLLLKSEALDEEDARRRIVESFGRHGIPTERLELLPHVEDHRQHLAVYSRVDIALDPFPYNGTTTTCEALWMGVPVIALRGNRHAARVGASILGHAGLAEWVAENQADYIALATARASDKRLLTAARPAIHAAFRDSPMTHPERFTPGLEQAYRRMWAQWCAAAGR